MINKKFDELRLTGKLPSPSAIGLRILDLTKDEQYSQEELTKTMMADPALSGRIIKLANAADRDGLESVETVPQSAMRLGAKSVRTIALGFTLIADNRSGSAERFDYDRFWSEALATAVASTVLARESGAVGGAEAFTCGLLCDIGRLAFASVHPDKYSELIRHNPSVNGAQMAELETRVFDINHIEVSAAMMADWGMSQDFQEAVLMLDEKNSLGAQASERAISLSSYIRIGRLIGKVLAAEKSYLDDRWCEDFRRLVEAAREFGLDLGEFYRLCDLVTPEWEDWGEVIQVRTIETFSFSQAADELERLGSGMDELGDDESVVPLPKLPPGSANPSSVLDLPDDPFPTPDEDSNPTRILLVDDDQRMLRLIGHHLRREGYEVTTADSSKEGLEKALSMNPQILITDWMMPGMTGVKLCETLRQSEAGKKMYVLIVTAREDDDQVVEAFNAGADDYIVKPFNPRILLARVRAGRRMIRMRERVEHSERVRLRQVAELGILTRKLRAAAMTDALTELPNRRYAMKRLKQEWDSSIRTGRPLSVIMGDIDFFKGVNDQFGHDTGDAVLRDIARVLRMKSRSGDILCRLGGEEFLSINMACDGHMAQQCAERLRKAIELHVIEYGGFNRGVTLSLGVSERTSEMICVDDLIKEADEALYEAKKAGRNLVVFRDPRKSESA